MDQLVESCRAYKEYPKNLRDHRQYEHTLSAYAKKLHAYGDEICCDESEAQLHFWEYQDLNDEFKPRCIRDLRALTQHLRISSPSVLSDPRCRFIFLHAPHSRERLFSTRDMLMLTLTYLHVMPSFLDFVFPFGLQLYPRDFHFGGFRVENYLSPPEVGLSIPELGRSGKGYRLCYSLRSAEESKAQEHWPWSIRHASIYHEFDVDFGRSSWIIVKGNDLIKTRITAESKPGKSTDMNAFETTSRAFAATLATHILICDWSAENWRWYINFLEEQLNQRTRRILSVPVAPPSPVLERPSRSATLDSRPGRTLWHTSTQNPTTSMNASAPAPFQGNQSTHPSSARMQPPELPPGRPGMEAGDVNQDFSFKDLQRIQHIEEKANEAMLVLKINREVIEELITHYSTTLDSEYCPKPLSDNCKLNFAAFSKRIRSLQNDLRVQQSKIESLLRLLADRKNLVSGYGLQKCGNVSAVLNFEQQNGILEYQTMETSKLLAERSQVSAQNMEELTRNMEELARETKEETVSMRIITLVTLIFLPGTFISTIMSTDIIRFQPNRAGKPQKTFQSGALQLYLAITLPLMFVTFAASYTVNWRANRKTRQKRELEDLRSNEVEAHPMSSIPLT